jgi:hypothetical protein
MEELADLLAVFPAQTTSGDIQLMKTSDPKMVLVGTAQEPLLQPQTTYLRKLAPKQLVG